MRGEQQSNRSASRHELDGYEPASDRVLAAVGVGRFGHEIVAHLVADLVEESGSLVNATPIPGLRVIGVDSDENSWIQARSPIQRAFRSLGRIANRIHLAPDVSWISNVVRPSGLPEEFDGLDLCFIVGPLNNPLNQRELPDLFRALDARGTKTIALLSLPEEWELSYTAPATLECLTRILATRASVITVPISSIGIPDEDLTWEEHLREVTRYFSAGFGTLLRASSWIEGSTNISLSDIFGVLVPGHRGALGFSEVSGVDTSLRIHQLIDDADGRLRRQEVYLVEASRVVAILSGSSSFTRSEVREMMAELQRRCGGETEIVFGTSRIKASPGELQLTLVV